MENYTVCQLQRDMRYEGFLLIRSAEKRKDSKGNDYVDMNLTDRTGEINCKIWNWDPEAETPEAGQPIKVRGTIQEYNGRLQLRVEKWRLCTEDDPVDMNALVPCAPRKPEDMFKDIEDAIEHFADEDLKKLTRGMLNLAGDRLRWFPAAQRMHHAERSGLLHHTTDMLRLADAMLNIYPWLNRDLLKAGVIIHDLGKIDEMKSDQTGNVTDYTRDGQLLGHLVRGITNLNKVAEETGVTGDGAYAAEPSRGKRIRKPQAADVSGSGGAALDRHYGRSHEHHEERDGQDSSRRIQRKDFQPGPESISSVIRRGRRVIQNSEFRIQNDNFIRMMEEDTSVIRSI